MYVTVIRASLTRRLENILRRDVLDEVFRRASTVQDYITYYEKEIAEARLSVSSTRFVKPSYVVLFTNLFTYVILASGPKQ